MINIIPAVMPESFSDLVEKIEKIPNSVKKIQIDVMDGHFVQSKSWPYKKDEGGNFEKMNNQEEGLPRWDDFDFSIDLMVSNPKDEIEKWINSGASEVIIHIESLKEDGVEYVKELKERGIVGVGIAISPQTPIEKLDQYVPYVDVVQFMGIENVGYQGEAFVPEVLDKIKDFHKKYADIEISVDGGVSFENAKEIVEVGAKILVSGSVLFNAINMKEEIEKFENIS